MKSLSISTATAAVAISLASSASANETRPYVMPEIDTLLFAEAPSASAAIEVPVSASETLAPVTIAPVTIEPVDPVVLPETRVQLTADETAPRELLVAAFAFDTPEGMLTLPASGVDPVSGGIAPLSDGIVTLASVDARYGDIDAFWGDIVAFYGDIDAFWGDISPFYGDIDAFWGDISPFYGDIGAFWGDIDAFYGDIGAFDANHLNSLGQFWESARTQISATDTVWNKLKYENDGGRYHLEYDGTPGKVVRAFNDLIDQADAQFGAAYNQKTGKDFRDDFVTQFLAKYGISLDDKKSFAGFRNDADRAKFFLDWHDSLNQYSGIDAVDHWMGAINWTPAVTQIQGDGSKSLIAVIDSSFSTGSLADNIVSRAYFADGANTGLNGHGAGVVSLIAGAHDGTGVMGIAPNANIYAFNPFDAEGKTTWARIGVALRFAGNYNRFNGLLGNTQDVSVINMSLGEKGWIASQGLADLLSDTDITTNLDNTVFVIAAGNEGVTQTQDVEWGYVDGLGSSSSSTARESDSSVIFVGSVRPDGTISNFSNRPGDACLLDNGVCNSGNELMNRFIVAPGELLLVNDGQGGVTRRSGTSFAAPLVSGAITLLHDRWPWLQENAKASSDIILRSARDLGAPGVDAVYGHGLLDVAASQSPLAFSDLTFTMHSTRSDGTHNSYKVSASNLLSGGLPSWWEANDVFLTAFENIDDTFRDFAIPMSSLQRGSSTDRLGNGQQRMQDFVADRFAKWLLSRGADSDGDGRLGVSEVRSNVAENSGQWTMRYDAMPPRFAQDGAVRPVHNAATLATPDGKASFTLGHGHGALALSGGQFGIASDHNAETGGVNPVLGLASGEVFGGMSYNIAPNTRVSIGFATEREDWEDLDFVSELDRQFQRQLGAREAEALTVAVDQSITDRFSVGVQMTHLDEADGLLGAQTGSDALLGEGSRTDAMTVSANFDAGSGLSFDLSVTGGATATNGGQILATNDRAISTAGQFAVNKRGVMNSRDILRVSVGQPLTVESGELELRSDQVTDRQTGERGIVSQFIGIDTKRRFTSEFVYATPVTDGAEFGLIGRYISAGEIGQDESFMLGANFGLKF